MIVVAMAQDKGVKRGRVDAHESGVVDQRVRRETEIYQDISCFGAAPRLDVHRQPELTDQCFTGWLATADAPAEVFDLDIGNLPARRDSELIAVDYHAYGHSVDLGNRAGNGFGAYRFRVADQLRYNRTEHGGAAAAHEIASTHCVALTN